MTIADYERNKGRFETKVLKNLVSWPQNDEHHALNIGFVLSIRLSVSLYLFRHSWKPYRGTCTSRPSAVHCCLL